MKYFKRIKAASGFTIVELLIVMAAAGLILLIVLAAIPVVQRNGRNNQRKQDVNIILQAASRYELNNSGKFPDSCDASSPCTSIEGGTPNDYFMRFDRPKLTFYTASDQIVLQSEDVGILAPMPAISDTDHVYIYNHQKCTPDNHSPTIAGAGYNDVIALYGIEAGGNSSFIQCQQL